MSVILMILVVLVIAALALWAVQTLPVPAPFGTMIQVLVIIAAIYVIAARSGVV